MDTTAGKFWSSRNVSAVEGSSSFLVIVVCMLLIFGNALTAKFFMVEDRTLLGLQPWTIHSWYQSVVSDAVDVQRFRPLYMGYVAIGASWFARNPLVWHLVTLLWGAISFFFFYCVARRLGAGIVAAAVFVAVLALSGNQSWIWVNLIPQETLGVLFLSIAAWAFSHAPVSPFRGRWDALGLLALVFAGLTKESFILVLPAMLMFRLFLEWRAKGSWRVAFGNLKLQLLAGALFFAAGITTVILIMMSRPDGFSATATGLSSGSFSPGRWRQLLTALGLNLPLLLSLVSLVVCAVRKPESRLPLAAVLVIALAWLAPQFVLYTRGIDGRYAFPAIIAVSALVALGMSAIPRGLLLLPQLVFVAVLLPIVANGWLFANRSANWLAAETVAMDRLVQYVAQNVPPSYSIVIAGDSGTGYGLEALHYSLPIYLGLAGSKSPVYAWPLVSKGARDAAQAARAGGTTPIANPAALDPQQVGAIIMIDAFTPGLHAQPLTDWLAGSQWNELSFAEPYRYIADIRKPSVGSDVVRHKVMVPARTAPLNNVVTIDHAVASNVGVSPLIDGPPWGLERDYDGPGMIAWLGHGDEEGMGGTFTANSPQSVTVAVDVVPGPSRAGYERTVELVLGTGPGQRVAKSTFNGGVWEFKVQLEAGANPFRLRVVDPPTVAALPNGDTRTLMALVRRITVRE